MLVVVLVPKLGGWNLKKYRKLRRVLYFTVTTPQTPKKRRFFSSTPNRVENILKRKSVSFQKRRFFFRGRAGHSWSSNDWLFLGDAQKRRFYSKSGFYFSRITALLRNSSNNFYGRDSLLLSMSSWDVDTENYLLPKVIIYR